MKLEDKIDSVSILNFIKKATKVLRKHKVKEPYYIKIHKINEGKAIPISDVKNVLFKKGKK